MVLGAAAAVTLSVFLAIFKARGKEIKEQEEQIKELSREQRLAELFDDVSEEVEKDYREEEEKLFQRYTDKPLTASLLSKLRDVQGLQNQTSNTPE